MTGIDNFTRVVNIVIYFILAIIALGFGSFFILKKKGFFKGDKDKIDYSKAEKRDVLDFMDSDIKENMIITDDYARFIAGVKVNGVDYYNGTHSEKARIITSYIEYINSISSMTKLYIQATEDDVSDFINYFDGLIEKHSKQKEMLESDISQLNQSLNKTANNDYDSQKLLLNTIEKKKIEIENIKWMIDRINHKKYFITQTSSNTMRDKTESYIFVEYIKPASFDNFTYEEMLEKAKAELDIYVENIIRGHSRVGVNCTPLNGNDLGRILRSAYNPLDGDKIKFQELLNSNLYSLVATGESSTELKMKAIIELEESNTGGDVVAS